MNRMFLIEKRGDQVESCLFAPENDRSGLLTYFESPGGFVVLLGRLHYQADLANRLGAKRGVVDAELALKAFERWDSEALEKLEGEFSVVFWSHIHKTLLVARDPQGCFPLFYAERSGGVLVSSSLFQICDASSNDALDADYLAEFLTQTDPRAEVLSTRTVFEGAHRVSAGSLIQWDANGTSMVRKYWDWIDRMEDPGPGNLGQYARLYRHRLENAIRERMIGRCAVHFSGGMDSTSVALLASEIQRSDGDSSGLDLLTMVYERLPRLASEKPFVEDAIVAAKGCRKHRIDGDDVLDFGAFTNPPPHEEPFAALWRLSMDRCLMDRAVELGADSVLTGCGADELIDLKPYHLADKIRRGRWISAWKESSQWALARGCNAWNILGPFALRPLERRLPNWMRGGLSMWKQKAMMTEPAIPDWFLHDYVQQYRFAERFRAEAARWNRADQSVHLEQCVGGIAGQPGDVVRWTVGLPNGIHYSHPFQDRRVQQLALGIASRYPPQPTPQKPLLASAMGESLPASIRERKVKGHFDELFYLGLSRHLPELESMIRNSKLQELGVLDAQKVLLALESATFGGSNVRQLQPLVMVLCLECWLANQADWRRRQKATSKTAMVRRSSPLSDHPRVSFCRPSFAGV